ncbi:oxidation resistance protein 1-like isoform X2 [Mizuhopecten yessoensis]|uniref:oxidation resistance protein 1-like isoform X2 n=1 Tax=Mizuhopecten yessoensis TaxID=6573 RepID=UPI000B45888B|nr:oxidation resistance protein 1-like isoform X2 [Mizuhopecten yessoensis]
MTTKRPSLKERAFEKLGFSPRFRSNTESSTGDDNSKTTWYTHSMELDPDSETEVTDSSGACNSGPMSACSNGENMNTAVQKVPDKKPKKVTPDGANEYTVKDTDSLESIAAFFDTTPSELRKLNRLTSRLIFPGKVLYVPKPEEVIEEVKPLPSSPKKATTADIMNHRPCMDIPLVKMADKPPAKIPGHIERQTSTTSPGQDSSLQKLSEYEAKQLDQDCHERFIKVCVKHITDGQGVVSGVLLVTPNAVMFDPNVSDPLVLEHGAERYGVIAPMDMIVSAAMYHDIAAMSIHGEKGVTKDAPKPEIYHDRSCPLYKSWVEGHAELMKQDPQAYEAKIRTPSRSATINSEMSDTGSLCSCGQGANAPGLSPAGQSGPGISPVGQSGPGLSPGSQRHAGLSPGHSEAGLSPVGQTRPGVSPFNQRLSPSTDKPVNKESEEDVMLIDLDMKDVSDSATQETSAKSNEEKGRSTSMDEFGEFISADPNETNQSESEHLSHDEKGDTQLSNQTAGVNEEDTNDVSQHSNLSLSRGGNSDSERLPASNQELVAGSSDDANSFHLENTMAVERVLSAQSAVISENDGNNENDSTMEQIGNIVYLPVSEGQQGAISLSDVETAQDRLSKISVGKFEQEDKPVSDPMDVPGSNRMSTGDPRQSSSFGSFNVSPHLSAFVNYATGLFKTNAEVKDICEAMSELEVQGEDGIVDIAQTENNIHKNTVKSGLEVENAIKLTDKPTLFQSFDGIELIPKPAATFDDLPLYLCLRLGMPINKEISQTCPIQAYGKGRKKPEYWFSIPREKVDHLYAFFVQWTPQIYGGEDDIAEKRGFIVLNDEEDEEEEKLEMMDEYFSNGMLQKDWEIISADEMVNRKKLTCEPEVLPELIGQSKIMEEKHIYMLNRVLPPRTIGYPWMMVYSTEQHGFSLRTLYRGMQGIDSPILLVVHDTSDNIFGAVTSQALKMSDHFYGTGESFMYTFYPEFKVFHWTGDNDFFLKGNAESLFIGAGQGNFGLWFDGDIYHGRTQHCETYDNDILTGSEDFVVKTLEAWAFFSD